MTQFTPTVNYPTDPLTVAEINAVTAAIKANKCLGKLFYPNVALSNTALILECILKEPVKAEVLAFNESGGNLNRKARAIVYQNTNNYTYEVIANLPEPPNIGAPISQSNLTCRRIKDVMYPNNNYDNFPVSDSFGGTQCFRDCNGPDCCYNYFTLLELTNLVLSNKCLLKKLRDRNVSLSDLTPPPSPDDPTSNLAKIFPYAFYTFESFRNFIGCCGKKCPDLVDLDAENHRYMPAVFFSYDSQYAPGGVCVPPANWGIVEGIYIIVDCTNKSIYRIVDDCKLPPKGAEPIPLAVPDPYPVISHSRLKPLCTLMPEGPSYTHDNLHFTFDNFDLRLGYGRNGLNIYEVYYTETVNNVSERRKILYKLGASDSLVVYNAAEPIVSRTYVSADSHNWPILPRLVPLRKGLDAPSYATFIPVVVPNGQGVGREIPDAIAIYEQDSDTLWRVNEGVIGLNWPNGPLCDGSDNPTTIKGAKKRQLVVRTIFSGFYYLFMYTYIFSQDGSFESYVDLMGQTTDRWVESNTDGEETPFGQRISKQYIALNHTHCTTFRADFDIDGLKNSVAEENSYPIEDKKVNKCGDLVDVVEKVFKREQNAVRDLSIKHNRVWSVENHHSLNRLGFPRSYHIYSMGPNGNSTSLAAENSAANTHLGFIKHHLHVTKYREGEQYAAGEFPVLADKETGLPTYIKNNECIEDTDVVLWLNALFFHKAHTEDYPFINTHRLGYLYTPSNFFGMNPSASLDQEVTPVIENGVVIGDCSAPKLAVFDQPCPTCP